MNKNPKTINGWLKSRDNFVTRGGLLADFNLGHLMPIVGKSWKNLIPKGKNHLFKVSSRRYKGICDYNSEKGYRNGKWYTKSKGKHVIYVESVAIFDGPKLEWLRGPSDVVIKFILPEGWKWAKDNLGIYCVDSDGIDYHPYWTENITIENILEGHAQNKESRKKVIENKERLANLETGLEKNKFNTFVLLEDSRRVGNCVEGSLSFAERCLGVNRNEILACPSFVKVPAFKLLNSSDYRAKNAALAAYERETIISI